MDLYFPLSRGSKRRVAGPKVGALSLLNYRNQERNQAFWAPEKGKEPFWTADGKLSETHTQTHKHTHTYTHAVASFRGPCPMLRITQRQTKYDMWMYSCVDRYQLSVLIMPGSSYTTKVSVANSSSRHPLCLAGLCHFWRTQNMCLVPAFATYEYAYVQSVAHACYACIYMYNTRA